MNEIECWHNSITVIDGDRFCDDCNWTEENEIDTWGYCYDCKHNHPFDDEDYDGSVWFANQCDECDCDYFQGEEE